MKVYWHKKRTIFRSAWFISSMKTAPKESKLCSLRDAEYKDYIHHLLSALTHMFKPLIYCSLSVLIGTECGSVLNEPGLVQISLWYCRWRWGLTAAHHDSAVCSLPVFWSHMYMEIQRGSECVRDLLLTLCVLWLKAIEDLTPRSAHCRSTKNPHCCIQFGNSDFHSVFHLQLKMASVNMIIC